LFGTSLAIYVCVKILRISTEIFLAEIAEEDVLSIAKRVSIPFLFFEKMEQERITKDELYRIMKLMPTYWTSAGKLDDEEIGILVHGMQGTIDDFFNCYQTRGRKKKLVSVEEFNVILQNMV
jgi:hypothetical protein